jgi:hypothetical protein
MLVRIKAMVQSVGEAEELVDICRTQRTGALIEARSGASACRSAKASAPLRLHPTCRAL